MEPYRLRRWRRLSSDDPIAFFTCARPGRSKGNSGAVPDSLVDKWVGGLPKGPEIVVVSLLGRKPNGLSEFSFYNFAGGFDTVAERGRRVLFEDWLRKRHPSRSVRVIEHPTTDFQRISADQLAAVTSDIEKSLAAGRTVVLVDSGGETRTRQVCKHACLVEDSRK